MMPKTSNAIHSHTKDVVMNEAIRVSDATGPSLAQALKDVHAIVPSTLR